MKEFAGLPTALRTVAEEIGLDAAIKLADEAGGQRVVVPDNAAGSALAKRLGEDIAEVLVEHWGGLHLYVPNWKDRNQLVREQIVRDNPHATANELVRMTGLSDRQVYRIRARLADEPKGIEKNSLQARLPLFDD